jgi:hypothetical protein
MRVLVRPRLILQLGLAEVDSCGLILHPALRTVGCQNLFLLPVRLAAGACGPILHPASGVVGSQRLILPLARLAAGVCGPVLRPVPPVVDCCPQMLLPVQQVLRDDGARILCPVSMAWMAGGLPFLPRGLVAEVGAVDDGRHPLPRVVGKGRLDCGHHG